MYLYTTVRGLTFEGSADEDILFDKLAELAEKNHFHFAGSFDDLLIEANMTSLQVAELLEQNGFGYRDISNAEEDAEQEALLGEGF